VVSVSQCCCRGKAIALRLAKDGYNITVNDIPANEEGLNEVSMRLELRCPLGFLAVLLLMSIRLPSLQQVVLQIKSMGRKAIPAIGKHSVYIPV
jgi:NAD(P)-dependent dehydrogenase (short-subunit alcohol dehydrogenase family)